MIKRSKVGEMYSYHLNTLVLTVIIVTASGFASVTPNSSVVVPLSNPTTWLDRQVYSDIITINGSSTIQFDLVDINENISFIIFQAHSYLYDVILSNDPHGTKNSTIKGLNVGLYSLIKPNPDTFYVTNPNVFDIKILISVHGYRKKVRSKWDLNITGEMLVLLPIPCDLTPVFGSNTRDITETIEDPVPGGCNMEFPIPVSPFMKTSYLKDYIFVDAAPARHYLDPKCLQTTYLNTEFYLMYMPNGNFDADIYFEAIKSMMTLSGISENGYMISKTAWTMRRMVSAYTGTRTVYVAIATSAKEPEYYSVYVPTYNYACPTSDDNGCEIVEDKMSKFLCASLLFVGIFLCYFGHRFFKVKMFLIGMWSGFLITYTVISIMADLNPAALMSVSMVSGIFFGGIWLSFWWFFGIPLLAVLLPALNVGFLLTSVIYNTFPGDALLLIEDFSFWLLFIMSISLFALVLITMAFVSNIMCCSVLGAYAAVFPLDVYLGSNLKYFIINIVRRATVPNFNKAVLLLPFGSRDVVVTVLWAVLCVTGYVFQHYQNRGRPPFPPPPRRVRLSALFTTTYGSVRAMIRSAEASAPSVYPGNQGYNESSPLLT